MPYLCPTCEKATFDTEKAMMTHFLAFTCTPRFSAEETREAFTLVQDKKNWKNPINAVIPPEKREVVEYAIIHYAGCVPTFTPARGGKLRVRAAGYYIAVGA